jgi:hypothetical protein
MTTSAQNCALVSRHANSIESKTTMKKQSKTFNIGDRVAYSVAFLRSTGQFTGDMPRLRGTVKAIEPFGPHQMVVIAWDGCFVKSHYHDDGLGRVINPNLTLVSRLAIDAALNT